MIQVVNLLTCMYMMFVLCIDLLYCFTWLWETCMNEWSSVSVFAMAISMLHETLSMQNFHNVNMSLCKASISCTSIHLACTVCIVCYWDSLESHPPPTNLFKQMKTESTLTTKKRTARGKYRRFRFSPREEVGYLQAFIIYFRSVSIMFNPCR